MPTVTADSAPLPDRLTSAELWTMLLLAAINCVQITDALLMAALTDDLQSQLGLTIVQYSHTAGIYGFAAALCGLLASGVIDRFDRRRVILTAFTGLIVSSVLSALAVDYSTLLIARFLAGMTGGLTTCATLAVIGDVIPEGRRGRALGLFQAAFAIAAVVGLPLCFGLTIAVKSFSAAFITVAAAGALVSVWAFFKLPTIPARVGPRANPLRELGAVLRVPNHLRAFSFMLCISLGTFVVINYMAKYMEKNCGVTKEQYVGIFIAMGACSLAAAILSGKLTDRLGRRPMLFVTVLLTVAMVGIVTTLQLVPVWLAGLVACGFMSAAVARLVPTHTIMLGAAEPNLRGGYTTVYNSVSHLGTSIGPLLGGLLITEVGDVLVGYSSAGLAAIGFSMLGLILSFAVKRATV